MLVASAAIAAGALILTAGAYGAERNATPGTLASVFAAAQPGDTIRLATGSYGTFAGGMKSGEVTLKPQAGATPSMRIALNPASNITIDGVLISDAELGDARTRNITVRNSDIPGQVTFRTGELANSNILFDNNVHRDWNKPPTGAAEGRVWLPENTGQPSGITIQNSEFVRGASDGVQNGSNGTRLINNEFHDLPQGDTDVVHTDAIQLYGSKNTVIAGNWFHDLDNGVGIIAAYDGADHELIQDNVTGPNVARPWSAELLSDDGSIVRHNTFSDGSCEFNLRCGKVRLGNKSGDDPGRGTVVENNIISETSGATSPFTSRFNLIAHQSPIGASDVRGLPNYLGGANATSYAGFKLTPLSPGYRSASDGADRGARITASPVSDPDPDPDPTPTTPTPTPPADAAAAAIWTAPTGARVGNPVTLDGTRSRGNPPISCQWSFENADGSTIWDTASGCTLRKTFTSAGAKHVRLTVTDNDRDTNAAKRSFTVTR